MISKEIGDSDGSVKYMELAADGYAESGSSDTSAMALSKAAAFLETCDPDKAIQVIRFVPFRRTRNRGCIASVYYLA